MSNVLRRKDNLLQAPLGWMSVGLAIVAIALLSGCRVAPDYRASEAVARYPPRSLGFEDGRGVYSSDNSYVVYLDHEGLAPSSSTQISRNTFSVTISIGRSRSRYQRAQAPGETRGSMESTDGATIIFRSLPHLEVMGASRMIDPDADITYLFHESRLPDLRRIDGHVISALKKAQTSNN